MKYLLIILFLAINHIAFSQRALSVKLVEQDWNPIISNSVATAKIDTLYFTNDTLYLSEGGRLFKTAIEAGADSYISNVTESGNNITFTGVGSAFNGSIGTIAKTDLNNNFVRGQTIDVLSGEYGVDVDGGNNANGVIVTAGSSGNFNVLMLLEDYTGTDIFRVGANGKIYAYGLTSSTQTEVLYRDPSTKEVTVGATPSGATFSGARVYHSANQSLTANVTLTLVFNSEKFDSDLYHNTSTNNSRLTIPSTGYYLITATFRVSSSGTNPTYIEYGLKKNGGVEALWNNSNQDILQETFTITELLSLSTNDYIELTVETDQNASITGGSGATTATFSITKQ